MSRRLYALIHPITGELTRLIRTAVLVGIQTDVCFAKPVSRPGAGGQLTSLRSFSDLTVDRL